MPKQKSHSSTKKRFWLTSTGKVKRAHGGKNHKAETKNRIRVIGRILFVIYALPHCHTAPEASAVSR